MNVIEVKDLEKTYHVGDIEVNALRGVNFSIKKGQFSAIMGPSGSGKSTLMHIIGCLDSPTKGRYHLNGENVANLSDDQLAGIRNKEIGFVFQKFHLLPRNTALDNVMLPLRYAKIDKRQRTDQAIKVLSQVGLEDRMHHKPSELSGGQQQRVAIARALVNSPAILFADEPTGNLDQDTGENITKALLDLQKQYNSTIILVTHDINLAQKADRVLQMHLGKLLSGFSA